MLALGSVKSILTDSVKSGRVHFDMHGFLTSVVLADLNLAGMAPRAAGGRETCLCALFPEAGEPGPRVLGEHSSLWSWSSRSS